MNSPWERRAYEARRDIIYVDESGNTGMQAVDHNRRHPFFIIGFCYCRDPSTMNRQMRSLLLRLHRSHIYPAKLNEIKFYPTPALRKLGYSEDEIKTVWSPNYSRIRDAVLNIILNYSDGVCGDSGQDCH